MKWSNKIWSKKKKKDDKLVKGTGDLEPENREEEPPETEAKKESLEPETSQTPTLLKQPAPEKEEEYLYKEPAEIQPNFAAAEEEAGKVSKLPEERTAPAEVNYQEPTQKEIELEEPKDQQIKEEGDEAMAEPAFIPEEIIERINLAVLQAETTIEEAENKFKEYFDKIQEVITKVESLEKGYEEKATAPVTVSAVDTEEIQKLKSNTEDLEKKLDDYSSVINGLREENKNNIETLINNYNSLREENKNNIETLSNNHNNLIDNVKADQVVAFESIKSRTEAYMQELKSSQDKLDSSLKDLQTNMELLIENQLNTLKESFTAFDAKIKDLGQQVGEEFNNKLNQLSSQNSELTVKITQLEEQITKLSDQKKKEENGEVEIPKETDLGLEIDDLLQVMAEHKASDLHLKIGIPPFVRLEGELIPVGSQALTDKDVQRLILSSMSANDRKKFTEQKVIDYIYTSAAGDQRFQVSAFNQKGSISATFHMTPLGIPTFEEQGLPEKLKHLALIETGIILVTGAIGSGKRATVATMLEFINNARKSHIVTIEDPITHNFTSKKSIITQRQVGIDTLTLKEGLKEAFKEDPDVIFVSNLDDKEVLLDAIMAAEAGFLVIGTLDTPCAVATLEKITEEFPERLTKYYRQLLASNLRAILSQRLVRRIDGPGRILACELLLVNPSVRKIIREGKLSDIQDILVQGSKEGMINMADSLTKLYREGKIKQDYVLAYTEQQTLGTAAPAAPASAVAGKEQATESISDDNLMNWL